jgi:hypothetical protein
MHNERIGSHDQGSWSGSTPAYERLFGPRATNKRGRDLFLYLEQGLSIGFGLEAVGTELESIRAQDLGGDTEMMFVFPHGAFDYVLNT